MTGKDKVKDIEFKNYLKKLKGLLKNMTKEKKVYTMQLRIIIRELLRTQTNVWLSKGNFFGN